MTGSDALEAAASESLGWEGVCERFHDIRERAHAHALHDDWRALVTEPGTPTAALLLRWQRLVDEIERLDASRDESTVRFGDDIESDVDEPGEPDDVDEADEPEQTDSAWLEEWEPESGQFGCPGDLCQRVRTAVLLIPKCWLLNRDMVPVPVAGTPSGGTS